MSKYKVWTDDDPEALRTTSLAKAIKYISKNADLDEGNSGLEEYISGEWDEWLDDDDQNIHEHLYMYPKKSPYLIDEDEIEEMSVADMTNPFDSLDDDDDEDFDDDDDDDLDDDDDEEEEERLLGAIGGSNRGAAEESFDEDLDDEEEEEDDFDDEEDED